MAIWVSYSDHSKMQIMQYFPQSPDSKYFLWKIVQEVISVEIIGSSPICPQGILLSCWILMSAFLSLSHQLFLQLHHRNTHLQSPWGCQDQRHYWDLLNEKILLSLSDAWSLESFHTESATGVHDRELEVNVFRKSRWHGQPALLLRFSLLKANAPRRHPQKWLCTEGQLLSQGIREIQVSNVWTKYTHSTDLGICR